MMGLPDVRSCCGCFSIEVGAKIIACVQLMTGGLFFAYCIESVIEVLLSENIYRGYIQTPTTVNLALCLYPIMQGTLLFIGIIKKRAGFLLIWLILSFLFEIFVSSLVIIVYAIAFLFFRGLLHAATLFYIGGIQIGISFFLIVIVSTCRKNILRRNALFDYGVLYTPDAVEILTPKPPTGLNATNPQFDYVTLHSPEAKQEVEVVK